MVQKKYRPNPHHKWEFDKTIRFARPHIINGNWYIGPLHRYEDTAKECEDPPHRRINKRMVRIIDAVQYYDLDRETVVVLVSPEDFDPSYTGPKSAIVKAKTMGYKK